MEIKEYLNNKGLSIYKLAKLSDVPYTTVNDIIHGRTRIEKCLAETVYKLAKALGVT
ncbi:MAG: helix-turn-helix domain-containing protein, partial [Firmicutes bacterium]|nr:helix-turn-helix domain-containing protein [Bacillota bacterium]